MPDMDSDLIWRAKKAGFIKTNKNTSILGKCERIISSQRTWLGGAVELVVKFLYTQILFTGRARCVDHGAHTS